MQTIIHNTDIILEIFQRLRHYDKLALVKSNVYIADIFMQYVAEFNASDFYDFDISILLQDYHPIMKKLHITAGVLNLKAVAKFPSLNKLIIENTNMSQHDLRTLFTKKFNTVETLVLRNNHFSTTSTPDYRPHMWPWPPMTSDDTLVIDAHHLKQLDIDYNVNALSIIAECTNLERLAVRNVPFSEISLVKHPLFDGLNTSSCSNIQAEIDIINANVNYMDLLKGHTLLATDHVHNIPFRMIAATTRHNADFMCDLSATVKSKPQLQVTSCDLGSEMFRTPSLFANVRHIKYIANNSRRRFNRFTQLKTLECTLAQNDTLPELFDRVPEIHLNHIAVDQHQFFNFLLENKSLSKLVLDHETIYPMTRSYNEPVEYASNVDYLEFTVKTASFINFLDSYPKGFQNVTSLKIKHFIESPSLRLHHITNRFPNLKYLVLYHSLIYAISKRTICKTLYLETNGQLISHMYEEFLNLA